MNKSIFTALVILALLLTAPVGAEIYKYTDENGQKRWTDDLSQVPKDQRASAQRMESIESGNGDATAEPAADASSPAAPEAMPDDAQAAENGSGAVTRDALEKEKAELDAQYQQLIEERKALEQMQADTADGTHRTELNQKISSYNSKTEAYEKRLDAFNEKINTYNQSIMKKAKPSASE